MTFDASEELRNLKKITQAQVDEKRLLETAQKAAQEAEKYYLHSSRYPPTQKAMNEAKKELNLDFSLNDNAVQKAPPLPAKKRPRKRSNNYSTTMVKARNFLANVSYNRVKEESFNNKLPVNDCYGFILLHLNPFYLERKFDAELDREYVNMIWYLAMPNVFYDFICRGDNYATLNKLRLRFQDNIEIAKRYTDNQSGFQMLSDVLRKHARVFQFVFGNLFPRYFSRINDYGIQSKLEVDNLYQTYQTQKDFWQYARSQANTEVVVKPEPIDKAELIEVIDSEKVKIGPTIDAPTKKSDSEAQVTKRKRKAAANNEKKVKKREEKKAKLEAELEANTQTLAIIKKFKNVNK